MKNITINTHFKDFPTFQGSRQFFHVNTDHKRLQQVLLNLLSNSLKFTDRNGKILINVEFIAGAKDYLRISVTDDGIGIKDKNKD